MAEDIRIADQNQLVERRRAEIQAEALRQQENCLYTFAGFSYVKDWLPAWAVALMGFVATLIPTIAKALDIETHFGELKRIAGDYKSLQDRFRQLARIGALDDVNEAEAKLNSLMDQLDNARSVSISPPERYFAKAQEKIKRGDYDFTVDIALREAVEQGHVTPLPKPE